MPTISVFASQYRIAAVLHERIDAIILLVPDDFPGKDATVKALKGRQNSIRSTAPTYIARRWMEVARILLGKLPDGHESDWVRQIFKLFSSEY